MDWNYHYHWAHGAAHATHNFDTFEALKSTWIEWNDDVIHM